MGTILFRSRSQMQRAGLRTLVLVVLGCGDTKTTGGGQSLEAMDAGDLDSGVAQQSASDPDSGRGDASRPVDCNGRSIAQCEDTPDCSVQLARRLHPERSCADAVPEPAACAAREALCLDSDTCRYDTEQDVLWVFGRWCMKGEYTATLVKPDAEHECPIDPLPPACE